MSDDCLAAIDKALMAAGDQRVKKARSEQERGKECRAHGDTRVADLADDHAWALRCQAEGLWEAAAIVRALPTTVEAPHE